MEKNEQEQLRIIACVIHSSAGYHYAGKDWKDCMEQRKLHEESPTYYKPQNQGDIISTAEWYQVNCKGWIEKSLDVAMTIAEQAGQGE